MASNDTAPTHPQSTLVCCVCVGNDAAGLRHRFAELQLLRAGSSVSAEKLGEARRTLSYPLLEALRSFSALFVELQLLEVASTEVEGAVEDTGDSEEAPDERRAPRQERAPAYL